VSAFGQIAHLLHQGFLVFDQVGNWLAGLVSLLCGHGCDDFWADETISAHSWRRCRDSVAWERWRRLWDALFYWQDIYLRITEGEWPVKRHCQRAYDAELLMKQNAPEYRRPER